MAKILRQGKTPYWGTWKGDRSFNTWQDGVIIESFNSNVEIKDFEQTDENGAVCGYLIYDQTVGFDMSGTLLKGQCLSTLQIGETFEFSCAQTLSLLPFIGYSHTGDSGAYYSSGINEEINKPTIAIVKNISFNTSAGGAATFSLSGTAYDFSNSSTSSC